MDKQEENKEYPFPPLLQNVKFSDTPNPLTGGIVNYYLCHVPHPQRENQLAYTGECEDFIKYLELTPDEANIFKEIWRSANARKNNGKPGHTAIYGAEKIVHYAGRILRYLKLEQKNVEPIEHVQV